MWQTELLCTVLATNQTYKNIDVKHFPFSSRLISTFCFFFKSFFDVCGVSSERSMMTWEWPCWGGALCFWQRIRQMQLDESLIFQHCARFHTRYSKITQWYISRLDLQTGSGQKELHSPTSVLLCSRSEPISWHRTHTILSTNCLSISPVPANYQLLMKGSPYGAQSRRGEGKEWRERVCGQGEEREAQWSIINLTNWPHLYDRVFIGQWRWQNHGSAQKSFVKEK